MTSPTAPDASDGDATLVVRPITPADFEAIITMQLRCFPGMEPWSDEHLRAHVDAFPRGQICVELDGEVVASCSSLIVDFDDISNDDFDSIVGDGSLGRHDPDGDTLYGVEMQVDPAHRGLRLSRRLYDARKELCRELNLERIVVGGRLPGYGKHQADMTPREYIDAVVNKRFYDPVLTSQLANGFLLRKLIPAYLTDDKASAGHATQLEWVNLDFQPRRRGRRQVVEQVRVASVQYLMRHVDSFEEFARQCEFFADTAGDYKADFVVFPELFTLQLLTLVEGRRPGRAARELAEFAPRYFDLFKDLAIRHNVNIVAGSLFVVEDDRLFNSAFLFRRDGSFDSQKKIHVTPSEARWWGVEGGDDVEVFDTDCGKVAICICYDVEFPELVRAAVAKGARILLVPYCTNDRYGHMRVQISCRARCIENHVYAVTAGCVGNLPFVENADVHYAQSGVYTPLDVGFAWDGIAAETSPNIETVLVHEFDVEALRRHRLQGTTRNWKDRRTDLYRVQWKADGSEI